jgi:hypothetical protein
MQNCRYIDNTNCFIKVCNKTKDVTPLIFLSTFIDLPEIKNLIFKNGVFSNSNIKNNNVVTFYPCDVVTMTVDSQNIIINSNRLLSKNKNVEINDINSKFLMVSENIKVQGDPDEITNSNYLGHLINHSDTPNCKIFILKTNIVCIVSTRDIKKDEEITVSYNDNSFMFIHM